MRRNFLVGLSVLAGVAILGGPVGLVWAAVAPRAVYVLTPEGATLANPATEALAAADGWFAVVSAVAGLACGAVAYVVAGRRHDVAAVVALAAGGAVAGLVAWRVGQLPDLAEFRHAVRTRPDGTRVEGFLSLNAASALVVWPLLAVATFGALTAAQRPRRDERPAASADDRRGARTGEPQQAGGGRSDLQPAPTCRDEDRGEVDG